MPFNPSPKVAAARFGKKETLFLTGLTYRQLDYWIRTGVIVPIKGCCGSGYRREYSFNDVVILCIAKRIKEEGIALEKIRELLQEGKEKIMRSGVCIVSIDLRNIASELEKAVRKLEG